MKRNERTLSSEEKLTDEGFIQQIYIFDDIYLLIYLLIHKRIQTYCDMQKGNEKVNTKQLRKLHRKTKYNCIRHCSHTDNRKHSRYLKQKAVSYRKRGASKELEGLEEKSPVSATKTDSQLNTLNGTAGEAAISVSVRKLEVRKPSPICWLPSP